MLKKFGLAAIIVSMLLVMTGCFDIEQPITKESEGIWNSYFVYPLSF